MLLSSKSVEAACALTELRVPNTQEPARTATASTQLENLLKMPFKFLHPHFILFY